MKTLIAAVAFGIVMAFSAFNTAFAQSYDPDLGSGNITVWGQTSSDPTSAGGGQAALARILPRAARTHSVQSAFAAVTPFGTPSVEQNARKAPSAGTREASIRECATGAAPYKQSTWG